jgi:ABC-type sugar transport system substrate-binding protein
VPQGQSIVLPPAVLCDSEAGDDDIQLTIFTAQGTVAVGALGATRIAAGANHSPSITLHGSLRAIVAAVQSGITYTADPAFAGNATIVYTVDDLGSGAPGGRLTATANQSVTVTGTHTSVQAWGILGE